MQKIIKYFRQAIAKYNKFNFFDVFFKFKSFTSWHSE